MEVACPKCGASNRNTSRFCARCGEVLPRPEAEQQGEEELNLPWLQAVQEKAEILRTGGLTPAMIPDEEPETPAQPAPPNPPPPQQAQQPPAQETGAATPQPAAQNAPAPGTPDTPDEPPPDWVVGILEPDSAAARQPDAAYEQEEMDHIMPWLGDKQGEAPQDAPGGAQGLPPWLSDVTVQETLQTQPPGVEQKPTDTLEVELEGLEPFIPPELEKKEPERPATPPPAPSRPGKTVPEWLKPLAPRLEDEEPKIERITPVTQVVLDSSDTLSEPLVKDIPVRAPRPGAVETLVALMGAQAAEAPPRPVPGSEVQRASAATARRAGLRQWLLPDGLIYLVVLASLLTVLLVRPPFGELNAPPATDVIAFFNAIETLPSDKPVLIVYDWDASRSAEMGVLSRAVTHHLMSRRLRFVTVSTVPQGPGFAREVTLAAANDPQANYGYDEYGRDYLVLGYLPGNEAALGALMRDFSTVLPLDYVNNRNILSYPIVQQSGINSLDDFGLIIDLAADEAALRNWVEQVGTRVRVPLIAGVPQGLEPIARPYRNLPGGGLRAVVSGQAGALQYTQQLVRGRGIGALYSPEALADRLNAQSVANLLVALVIVAAFVGMATRRIIRR